MEQTTGESDHWRLAVASADLGLPPGHDAKLRLITRLIARTLRPLLRRQIEFNREVLSVLVEVRNGLAEDIRSETNRAGADTADAVNRVAALEDAVSRLASELERRGWAIDEMLPVLEGHGYALEAGDQSLQQVTSQVNELREEVEVEVFTRIHDGIGALRREFGDLTTDVEARLEELGSRSANDR